MVQYFACGRRRAGHLIISILFLQQTVNQNTLKWFYLHSDGIRISPTFKIIAADRGSTTMGHLLNVSLTLKSTADYVLYLTRNYSWA